MLTITLVSTIRKVLSIASAACWYNMIWCGRLSLTAGLVSLHKGHTFVFVVPFGQRTLVTGFSIGRQAVSGNKQKGRFKNLVLTFTKFAKNAQLRQPEQNWSFSQVSKMKARQGENWFFFFITENDTFTFFIPLPHMIMNRVLTLPL